MIRSIEVSLGAGRRWGMLRITFTEKALERLRYERYHHPHPRVQQKMEALILKAEGIPHHAIARIVGVSENTVRSYFREYVSDGIESLLTLRFRRPTSDLDAHSDALEEHFTTHPPTTIPHACREIERITGIKRRPTQVGQFLKRMGLKRLRVYSVPAKVDPEAQETFLK
jgi:transposase